jgi:hypothetical protein
MLEEVMSVRRKSDFRRLSTWKIPLDPPFPKGEVSFSYMG